MFAIIHSMVNDSSLPKPSSPPPPKKNSDDSSQVFPDKSSDDSTQKVNAQPDSDKPNKTQTAGDIPMQATQNDAINKDDSLPPPPTLQKGSVPNQQNNASQSSTSTSNASPGGAPPPPRPSMTASTPPKQQSGPQSAPQPSTQASSAPSVPAAGNPGLQAPPPPSAAPSSAPPPSPSASTGQINPNQQGQSGPPGSNPPAPTSGSGSGSSASQSSSGSNPVFASASKFNLKKIIPMALGALVFIGVLGFAAMQFLNRGSTSPADTSSQTANSGNNDTSTSSNTGQGNTGETPTEDQTILSYWGLWEPSEAFQAVLDDFSEENPGVIVEYTQRNYKEYRERLQSQIAGGNGPDLFRFHATWTPMLRAELATMPQSVMSAQEYQEAFYPAAADQLQIDGQIVGIPLMYDGLTLYYNTEMFNTAQVQPPNTWSEMRTIARQLTVRDSDGSIQRAGAALGNASNVDHFSDVIGLLMLQNGADPRDPTSQAAKDAMQFYTNFVKEDGVWSPALPDSTVAFARGEVAMMFGPSWRAHQVLAINPNIEFATTAVPKLSDAEIGWATYWAEGVNDRSENKRMAWELLKYLSTPEVQQRLYSEQSELRAFGEPYSQTSLREDLVDTQYVGGVLEDAPNAQGWYLAGSTHDNGVNDQLIQYYRDAVNSVLSEGQDVDDVMSTVARGTQQVLRQYGIETGSTSRSQTN